MHAVVNRHRCLKDAARQSRSINVGVIVVVVVVVVVVVTARPSSFIPYRHHSLLAIPPSPLLIRTASLGKLPWPCRSSRRRQLQNHYYTHTITNGASETNDDARIYPRPQCTTSNPQSPYTQGVEMLGCQQQLQRRKLTTKSSQAADCNSTT